MSGSGCAKREEHGFKLHAKDFKELQEKNCMKCKWNLIIVLQDTEEGEMEKELRHKQNEEEKEVSFTPPWSQASSGHHCGPLSEGGRGWRHEREDCGTTGMRKAYEHLSTSVCVFTCVLYAFIVCSSGPLSWSFGRLGGERAGNEKDRVKDPLTLCDHRHNGRGEKKRRFYHVKPQHL